MDALQQAADRFFPTDGSRRTLNLSAGLCGRARQVSAEEIAKNLLHADDEILAGRARLVANID